MRKILLVLALLGLGIQSAHAQQRKLAVASVIGTLQSTMTVSGMDISTAGATSVVAIPNYGYQQVCVQNLSTTAQICCGESTNVNCTAASPSVGVVLAPASSATSPFTPVCFLLAAGQDFYCRSAGGAATRASVIRVK